MNVDPDVAFIGQGRSARVNADPDPDRPISQFVYSRCSRLERTRRGREGNEERVPLGIDLYAAVGSEGLTENAAVLAEGLRVVLGPEPVQKVSRALYVGE
jgi:hypothetical protein